MKFAKNQNRQDLRARSRVFYVFWHKFYAWHMLLYTILWQMYYKSMHVLYHMIRMIRAEAQIPQVQMDAHLSPIVFRLSVLSHWRKAIFAFSCQDVLAFAARGVVKWARGREGGTCELRAEQLLQAMIYFRPIWARGCPSNGPHLQRMPRKTTWKRKAKREKINKMGYAEYIEFKSG